MSFADAGGDPDQTAPRRLQQEQTIAVDPHCHGNIDRYSEIESYLAACIKSVGVSSRIPAFRPVTRYDPAAGDVDWVKWASLIVEEHQKLSGLSPAARTDVVVAITGRPESVLAVLFAARTDRSLYFVDSLADATGLLKTMAGASATIFVSLDDADDVLLFEMLDAVEQMLTSFNPWQDLPKYGLVTGRDFAAASALTARLIAAASRPDARPDGIRVRRYAPAASSSEVCTSTISPDGSVRADRSCLRQAELLASYRDRVDVMAFQAHGSEACAKGGDGTVLCGLHRTDTPYAPQVEGVLACGRGQICPRGPHPVPLRQMAADVIMLATCNGLRLADSRTRPEFNFGLSFVDGDGVAYVSSAFSCSGGGAASTAFPAAMAAGCTVGEATVLINGLLHHAGLDRIAFVAIADPEHRATTAARVCRSTAALPAHIDLGSHHFAELAINDPVILDAAQHDTLALTVTSDRGDEIVGYHRVQKCADGSLAVMALLFSFPEPLGRVHVVAADRRSASDRALAILARLDHWAELLRLFEIDSLNPEGYGDFVDLRQQLRLDVGKRLGALGVDGGSLIHLDRQLALGDRLALAASEQVLEQLVPKLEGAFWLSNAQAEQHAFERGEPASCPTCCEPAFRRIMRHVTGGEYRAAIVCPKCGIGSDIGGRSGITSIAIETPALVAAGGELKLSVIVRADRPVTVAIHPRLSTHEEFVPPPTPEAAIIDIDESGAARADFLVEIPRGLSPHRHYVKVLAACADGLAFASRPLFVDVAADACEAIS